MTKEAFAKVIKNYRLKTGKTLYELAQMLHTGAGTISRWENNHAAPPEVARLGIIKRLKNE